MTFNRRWEGPYKIVKVVKPGTYRIMDPNGYILPRPWHIEHLRTTTMAHRALKILLPVAILYTTTVKAPAQTGGKRSGRAKYSHRHLCKSPGPPGQDTPCYQISNRCLNRNFCCHANPSNNGRLGKEVKIIKVTIVTY
jgi:hypothetical protein